MEQRPTSSPPVNPYVAAGALDPSGRGFYGREDIFEFVRSGLNVAQRCPLLLYGQRRMGKSSILRQLPSHLPPEWVCVYFDLQGKANMQLDQVLYGLARAMTERLGLAKPEREEATDETFASRFFARALAAVDGDARRLVLLFDEFDVVDEKLVGADVAARRFIGWLSEFLNARPQVGCILVVGRKTEELSSGLYSSILKHSMQTKIGRLKLEQTARLIRELSSGYLLFPDEVLRLIYELAAGHPFCTQVLCSGLWLQNVVGEQVYPVEVTAGQVTAAVPLALERGTNGMNWIFDGITNPAQRLFMSAMAGEMDVERMPPRALAPMAIERLLRSRQIGVDRAELNRAPDELARWDIIIKGEDGYRFAVPIVGLWIKKERPLEQLMNEARFSNPQAYQYYELAEQARQGKNYERTVVLYKGAVEANPVFVEAYRGLAAALNEQKAPGYLAQIIEAQERIREIDSNESPMALLDTLVLSLEEPDASLETLLKRYQRIRELDEERDFISRANRHLERVGLAMIERRMYWDAERIFREIDQPELIERVKAQIASAERFKGIMVILALLPAILVTYASYITLRGVSQEFEPWMIYLAAAAAGGALSLSWSRYPFKRTLKTPNTLVAPEHVRRGFAERNPEFVGFVAGLVLAGVLSFFFAPMETVKILLVYGVAPFLAAVLRQATPIDTAKIPSAKVAAETSSSSDKPTPT